MSKRLLPPNASPLERAVAELPNRWPEPSMSGPWDADTCPLHLLPWLANAIGVMSWDDEWSEDVKREAIKSTITIRRRLGTVWAVRRAANAVGYAGAEIVEGSPALMHNAEITRGTGTLRDGGSRWANFRVIVDLGESEGVDSTTKNRLITQIEHVKPARSVLQEISYTAAISDTSTIAESQSIAAVITTEDIATPGPIRIGSIRRNGSELRPAPRDGMSLTLESMLTDNQTVGQITRARLVSRDGVCRHGAQAESAIDGLSLVITKRRRHNARILRDGSQFHRFLNTYALSA